MKQVIRGIICFWAGLIIGIKFAEKRLAEPLQKIQEEAVKFQSLFQMMGGWLEAKLRDMSVAEYCKDHGYNRVAIYGMGLAGQILYEELKGTDVQVLYAIDRNKANVISKVDIYSPTERLPKVDAIIISAITYFEEIADMLQERVNCDIVSLEDIVYDL